jgi:hypothetical protein
MLSVYARRRILVAAGVLFVLGGIGVAVAALSSGGGSSPAPAAPAPQVVIQRQQPEAATQLGFPAFATKNTTRVAGADPIADAAGVALAVFPSQGGVPGPDAVTLVNEDDWAAAIASGVLAGPPVRAPILIGSSDGIPTLTADALRALAPQGSAATDDRQIFAVGDVVTPPGTRALHLGGSSAAAQAVAIADLRDRLTGSRPRAVVVASDAAPAFAMPAAGWAARSGDPVLFAGRTSVPKPTLTALGHYSGVPVFVLGPESAISAGAFTQIRKAAPSAQRISADDPVASAIKFARYLNGSFGWNINDPGHGFVIANDSRPLDAAAAAPLSASGDWGPLLVTDDAGQVPPALNGYLLDVKPGYADDPTRAVYNHVWLIGDQDAISVPFQSRIDDLAEVAPVQSGG